MKKTFLKTLAVLALSGTALAATNYTLKIEVPTAKVNQKAIVHVRIAGSGGFHLNADYPTKLTITAPTGVALEKSTLQPKDAVSFAKEGADFAINLTASTAGKKSFTGTAKFAVCTDQDCRPQSAPITFEVSVQ